MEHIKSHKQIAPSVWVYNNFIEDIDLIQAKCKDHFDKNGIDVPTDILKDYESKLFNLVKDEYVTFPEITNIVHREVGMNVPVHTDVVNYECKVREIQVDPKSDIDMKEISMSYLSYIIYINDDYTGGEIFYPEHDLVYKPKAGDIVIHDVNVVHGVKDITKGQRVTFAGQVHKIYHVDLEKFSKLDVPIEPISEDDPRFFFQEGQGDIQHPRLKKYLDNKAVD